MSSSAAWSLPGRFVAWAAPGQPLAAAALAWAGSLLCPSAHPQQQPCPPGAAAREMAAAVAAVLVAPAVAERVVVAVLAAVVPWHPVRAGQWPAPSQAPRKLQGLAGLHTPRAPSRAPRKLQGPSGPKPPPPPRAALRPRGGAMALMARGARVPGCERSQRGARVPSSRTKRPSSRRRAASGYQARAAWENARAAREHGSRDRALRPLRPTRAQKVSVRCPASLARPGQVLDLVPGPVKAQAPPMGDPMRLGPSREL